MTFTQRVLRGALWSTASGWGRQGASLVILLILARLLAIEAFGVFALAATLTASFQVLVSDGLGEAVVQAREADGEAIDAAFWLNTILAVVLALGLAAAAVPLAWLFAEPGLAAPLAGLAVGLALGGPAAIYQAALRRRLDFKVLALRALAGILAGGLVGVALALNGAGVWSLVGQQLTEQLVGVCVLAARGPWRPGRSFDGKAIARLLPYGAKMALSRWVMLWAGQIDRVILGLFLGPAALGVWGLAQRVLTTMTALINDGASGVALATFCRLQDDRDRLRPLVEAGIEVAMLVALPAYVGAAVVAPRLVPLLFGPPWAESGVVLGVLALAGLPRLIHGFTAAVARAAGRANWYLAMIAAELVIAAAVTTILAPQGLRVVAIGLALGETVMVPVNLFSLVRLVGLRWGPLLVRLVPAVLATLAMAGVAVVVESRLAEALAPAAALGVAILAGAVFYGAVMAVTAPDAVRRLLTALGAARERQPALAAPPDS